MIIDVIMQGDTIHIIGYLKSTCIGIKFIYKCINFFRVIVRHSRNKSICTRLKRDIHSVFLKNVIPLIHKYK